jgi:hypothetical protein
MSDIFEPFANSSNEDYIVVSMGDVGGVEVNIVGIKSKSMIHKYIVARDQAKAFIPAIPQIFDAKCKAIIFDIYKFIPTEYHCMHFCSEIRRELDALKIPHFFYSGKCILLAGLLVSSKIKPIKDDVNLILLVKENEICVKECKFTELGHEQIREVIVSVDEKDSYKTIHDKVLGESMPKNIIVFGNSIEAPMMVALKKNIFPDQKLILRERDGMMAEVIEHSLKIAKYIQNHAYAKYHVIPKCPLQYMIYFNNEDWPFITVPIGEPLPYIREEYFERKFSHFRVECYDENSREEAVIYESKRDSQARHRTKFLFTVDFEGFPNLSVKPMILDVIKDLPPRLDTLFTNKIPVIVFADNFSVICACKKDETSYDFLQGWNGMFGVDTAIYHDGAIATKGYEATVVRNFFPQSGLSDIILLMSKTVEELKEAEIPALAEVEPEVGIRDYMSKLLKEHFKAIEEETEQKVTEVAFWLVLNYGDDGNALIKKRLIETLKPMEIVSHLLKFDVPQ